MSMKDYYVVTYLPTPLALEYSDFAVHEYLGILWYRLKNAYNPAYLENKVQF